MDNTTPGERQVAFFSTPLRMMTAAHLVAHVLPGWGHTKPFLALIARMFELQAPGSLTVTLLTSAMILPKIDRELNLMPGPIHDHFNLIDVSTPESLFAPNIGVISALESLTKGERVVCNTTGRKFSLPPATVMILDVFMTQPVPIVKRAAGGCPVIVWMSAPLSSCMLLHSPTAYGGAAWPQTGGMLDIADSVFGRVDGRIIHVPGLPDAYDYEYQPQVNANNLSMGVFLGSALATMNAGDGMLAVSTSAFEGTAIEATRTWFAETGRKIWVVGPLEDAPAAATANIPGGEVLQHVAEDAKILGFLDEMEQKHGARSVIFIAFGTVHYPKDPTKLHTFIDELIASRTPFLWSHASPSAQVPNDINTKIAAYECGHHASWVPQRVVLRHAATGWFVSHGGWNSTQEALSLRVPTIMWPFIGDQPGNAALLSVTHEAAFELLSVREGVGAQQPLRMQAKGRVDFTVDGVRKEVREILVKIKGPEGERVRANAERLGAELDKSWNEYGEARRELQSFIHKFHVAI